MSVIKSAFGATTALVLGTLSAQAGGIERNVFNPGFLFQSGNWVELSFGVVSPDVSGGIGPLQSGDMVETYSTFSGAIKQQLTDSFALGLVVDQPTGVDVSYPTGTGYPFAGTTATINTVQVSVLGHYRFSERVSAYGGLRAERAKGDVVVTPLGPYRMSTNNDLAYGFVIGAAYEIPEIALRVSLSYVSDVTHDFAATDNLAPTPADFSTTVPQSVNLDFQTGIAKDTLLFGSVRWRDWSEFRIVPRGAVPLSVDNKDTITYSLGVGRKFSEAFSGSVSVGYEPKVGGVAGNLGPTDGYTSLTLAGVYTTPTGMKITVGGSYGWIGDATTDVNGAAPGGLTTFADNNFTAFGVKVGWNF